MKIYIYYIKNNIIYNNDNILKIEYIFIKIFLLERNKFDLFELIMFVFYN